MKFLEVLYAHVGTVLKALAMIFFVLGALACVVTGIFIIVKSEQGELSTLYGLYLMVFGPIATWIASLPLFGFGELIEKTVDTNEKTADTNEVINNLDEQLYNMAKSIIAIEKAACNEERN